MLYGTLCQESKFVKSCVIFYIFYIVVSIIGFWEAGGIAQGDFAMVLFFFFLYYIFYFLEP